MTEAIHLTAKERRDLNALVRERLVPQALMEQAHILPHADAGVIIRARAQRLRLARITVQRWRRRWLLLAGWIKRCVSA